jgi:HEAT repeat protein
MKSIATSSSIMVFLVVGCDKPQPPPLAGGKPVEHWLKALQDRDSKVRKTAVTKLGNVGVADPLALPAVLGTLKDPDAGVRGEAILAVLKFGPLAREAVPTLTTLKDHDADPRVRTFATKALQKIQSEF